jgi:hypothetical protein
MQGSRQSELEARALAGQSPSGSAGQIQSPSGSAGQMQSPSGSAGPATESAGLDPHSAPAAQPSPNPSLRGRRTRRGTVLLMIVGLLAMLFMLVSAYIVLARFDRQALKLVSQADQVTQILSAINDLMSGAIRGTGNSDLVSGTAYVDAPGLGGVDAAGKPWGAGWLALPEPVHRAGGGYLPRDYVYPAVTSLSGGPATGLRLPQLILDANADGTAVVVPVSPPSLPNPLTDTLANTQQAFMDADGDGIPDSHFGACAVLTELANAMEGQGVRATGIDPSSLPSSLSDPNHALFLPWQQFDQTARYMVAAKIISHGGMVQVSAPTNLAQWNSQFIQQMFWWAKYPSDNPLSLNFLPAMAAESTAVEPVLRRRGGLLIGSRGASQDGVPPALYAMQAQYPNTFNPPYVTGGKDSNWQRFNLASLTDWNLWYKAVTIDAERYLIDPIVERNGYMSRQLLTTVNNSDELARIEDPNGINVPGFLPGKAKFYLGAITDTTLASNNVPMGAFLADGSFNDRLAITGMSKPQGFMIVRELFDYFREMLQAYDDSSTNEAVSRDEQAWMLAVNTVAFAAPAAPSAGGVHVDAVYSDPAFSGKIYIGYAPQPFITQVVAYNKTTVLNDPARVALAIELYNPNDPYGAGQLDPGRFGISINDAFDPSIATTYVNLGQLSVANPAVLNGRSFSVFVANDGGNNTFFDDKTYPVGAAGVLAGLSVPYPSAGTTLKVRLWRRCADTSLLPQPWYKVDQFEVDTTNPGGSALDPDKQWYLKVQRDTAYEPYFGRWSGTIPVLEPQARWRVTVAFPSADPVDYPKMKSPPVFTSDPTTILPELGAGNGSPAALGTTFGPCVPLYTMNPTAAAQPYAEVFTVLHGAARPAAFPTAGFMLFVPRFSHTVDGATRKAVTEILYEQWQKPTHAVTGYPADFGHMPIFNNTQALRTAPDYGGFQQTGRVPWGLLVFDYFTTLNPNGPDRIAKTADDIDPCRVPGRININDASWYVLAGLPLIGPTNPADWATDLPLGYVNLAAGNTTPTNASPAFWSANSGVLVGAWADSPTIMRYPGTFLDRSTATSGQWYRLGPYLGQAAAAYRDRVAYVSAASAPFDAAHFRNAAGIVYRPAAGYGSIRQTTAGTNLCRGFLSLGELGNVMGFDGSNSNELLGLPAPLTPGGSTVLGGYDAGAGSNGGDFMKAVSLLALLDTHFLTTRSNTFTIYATLTDRKNPQASVRSQMTVDRSNLLPRLIVDALGNVTVLQNTGPPELIGQRETSYFNARYDE